MRKDWILILAAFFLLSTTVITGVYAREDGNGEITITEDKVDVTGDQKKDTVSLKGVPYDEDTKFLKEIYLEITASNGKRIKETLDGGYDPKVQYLDLNHDGVKDMFVSVETGGSGGISNYYLYTFKNFKLTDLTVPEPLVINGQFQNGYKASITIQETGESYTFDLKDRANDYEQTGLYQHGKLSEPTELMVDPYSTLKPIAIKGEQFGLIGIQSISGAYHADRIAFVESIWFYENGKWTLKNTKVIGTNPRAPEHSK